MNPGFGVSEERPRDAATMEIKPGIMDRENSSAWSTRWIDPDLSSRSQLNSPGNQAVFFFFSFFLRRSNLADEIADNNRKSDEMPEMMLSKGETIIQAIGKREEHVETRNPQTRCPSLAPRAQS